MVKLGMVMASQTHHFSASRFPCCWARAHQLPADPSYRAAGRAVRNSHPKSNLPRGRPCAIPGYRTISVQPASGHIWPPTSFPREHAAILCCRSGGGFAHGYGTLMTARIFQSIGISTGFVIPGIIVVDLFRTEERGSKNGVWAQMVSMGAPLGGLIGGPIVSYLGWQWVMWIISIICGAQLLAFILTCPETSYLHRQQSGFGAYRASELFRLQKRIPGRLGW